MATTITPILVMNGALHLINQYHTTHHTTTKQQQHQHLKDRILQVMVLTGTIPIGILPQILRSAMPPPYQHHTTNSYPYKTKPNSHPYYHQQTHGHASHNTQANTTTPALIMKDTMEMVLHAHLLTSHVFKEKAAGPKFGT